MSNLIPPLLSSSPPPIVGPLEEDDDDEFGDFRVAADSYDCDDFSLPSSPQKSPEKELKTDCPKVNLDINCNKSQKVTSTAEMPSQNVNGSTFADGVHKDFQDRRKSLNEEIGDFKQCEIEVNCSSSQSILQSNDFDTKQEDIVSSENTSTVTEEQQEGPLELTKHQNDSKRDSPTLEDDFSDLQCAVENSSNGCEESSFNDVDQNSLNIDSGGQSNCNSLSNEENLFEAFSESVQENTSNSDNLSDVNETNEIKSDNDCIEQYAGEIVERDTVEEDNCDPHKTENGDSNESSLSLRLHEIDPKVSDDEFGDFANHFEREVDTTTNVTSEYEFTTSCPPLTDVEEQIHDEFGDFESSDFADFSSQNEKPTFLDIDERNAADKSEIILKDIFPSINEKMDEFEYDDETKGNVVFHELKDVTETKALIYQWSKSHSQKLFFKALNIDTRNILYGPSWNSSMPRFAANLGLTPLEPMKTEILTPTPLQNVSSPSNSSQKNGDIPTAQFDWNGSGLINPLDSVSSEVPGNVPEDSSHAHVQLDFLPTTSDKAETVPTLFEKEVLDKKATEVMRPSENEQTNDFSPFQSPKLIPLRETYISSEVTDISNKPGWLQPTILTPDLPRKETVVDPVDDDEFDDFQMVLPKDQIEDTTVLEVGSNTLPRADLSEFDMTNKVPSTNITSHNHEHILGISLNSGPINASPQEHTNDINDEDEFTDFHSSLPQTEILKPLPLVSLEPLKPTVQYSQPLTQINWPAPGVTDEDIQNIELSYSRKSETKETTVPEVSKGNSLEDDEWTDFVSVTNTVKSVLPERTATPDLPLSVLNLNNVQAPKQPIPVITPSGLVQTKLSSNMTLQPKSVVQTKVQPTLFRPPSTQFQPSIISSQYAANFPGTSATLAPSAKSQSQDDDDDWSEFVSSQPSQSNGYQQKSAFNQMKAHQINWTNATTNIIMNPTHFETLQSYGPSQNKKVSTLPTKHVIPSISAMPDLDFIAPKNRTNKK